MQLGIDLTASTVRLAVADGEQLRFTAEVQPQVGLVETLAAARACLPPELDSAVTAVRIAIVPGKRDLQLTDVGVLRIAPRSMAALRPFAAWPGTAGASLRARSAEVPGGSDFVGNHKLPADPTQLCEAASGVVAAGASRLVVSAAGAPSAPWLERTAAGVLRTELGLHVEVAHELGGTGVREREHAAALNLGLTSWAEAVVADARRAFPDSDLGFAHGMGGFGSAAEFVRQPLGVFHGVVRAAVLGVSRVTGHTDFILVSARDDSTTLVGVTGGEPDRADVEQLWGVTHNHLALDSVELPLGAGADPATSPLGRRMLARRPGYPVVAIGDAAASGAEPAGLSGVLQWAIAFGATQGRVTVLIERVLRRGLGTHAAAEQTLALVEEAVTRATLAGAAPSPEPRSSADVRPLAYVSDPVDTVRVRVSGAPA
ncbi:hypothetical protein ACF07D_11270 [Leucobacter sp. NPDC015123]|uniref:hypothetical protein n=1 Tax=Leucobacter sp. NPDC015123 TaxID=3364129 RepID=UPI0036F45B0C